MTTAKKLLDELQVSIERVKGLIAEAKQPSLPQFRQTGMVAEAETYWREQIAKEIEQVIISHSDTDERTGEILAVARKFFAQTARGSRMTPARPPDGYKPTSTETVWNY